MNQLKNTFQGFGFSDSEANDISMCFALKHYKSGDLFIQRNVIADYLGFIDHGIFQFYYDNDSDEITTHIALKNDFILSVPSYFANQKSKENIKALVDSNVYLIKKSDFDNLQTKISGFKDFYIKVLEQILVCLEESRFDYITLKPEERYSKFLNEEPELIKHIPLKYLSTLIGVTPRHLSRIRNNIR